MAHAVVMQVKLPEEGRSDEGLRMLKEMVVPQARSQEGFQKGLWMNDGANGLGVVVFDSAQHAQAAHDVLKPPTGGPQLMSSAVYEVAAEA